MHLSVACRQYAARMRWKVEWLVDRSMEPASIPAYRFLKPNKTALSDAEYEAVGALAAKIAENPPPFASVDDFIQADLKS